MFQSFQHILYSYQISGPNTRVEYSSQIMSGTKKHTSLYCTNRRSAFRLRWYFVSVAFPFLLCNSQSTAASPPDKYACNVVIDNHRFISTPISVDISQHNKNRNRGYYIPLGRHWFRKDNDYYDVNDCEFSKVESLLCRDKSKLSTCQENTALRNGNTSYHYSPAATTDFEDNESDWGNAGFKVSRRDRPNCGETEWRSFDNKIQSGLLSPVESIRRLLPSRNLSLGSVLQSRRKKTSMTSLKASSTAITDQSMGSTSLQDQQNIDVEASGSRLLEALTQPLIDETVWDDVVGNEFQLYPQLWDKLATMGEALARNDNSNEWIEWNNIMKGNENDISSIHVWIGRTKKANMRGSSIPFIKTRSVIPYRPQELATLLLDSARVKSYSKFSVGRIDCWLGSTMSKLTSSAENDGSVVTEPFSFTKIVQNRIQPPLGGKQMISTTFMHAQPCRIEGSAQTMSIEQNDNCPWITVSRAVGGNLFSSDNPGEDDKPLRTSEILLGINYIQPYDDNHSVLTSINHVYSAAVPTMLAERIGVKSAIQFINDLCSLKVLQKS